MRRAVGSITKLAENKYRVSVSAGRHPVTGKRLRPERIVNGSRRKAEQALDRLILEVGKGLSSTMRLESYLTDVWLPALDVRRKTASSYETNVRVHITPYLGQVPLDQLKPYAIDRWLRDLERESGARAFHAYSVLRNALNAAVRWQLLSSNPVDAVGAPKWEPYDPRVLSVDEANAMLDGFVGHPVEAAIVLALGAGLRRSEIAGLRWTDFNWSAGTVSISRGLHQERQDVWEEAPKSRNSKRVVSLPQWAIDTLKPMRAVGPVFVEGGQQMKPVRISRLYEARRDALKLPAVPLKDLRHSHATIALQAGVDVVVVSRRLGHSTVSVTDRYYLRPQRSADEAAAKKVDGIRHK